MNPKKWKRFIPFWIIGGVIFLADQLTKHLVTAAVPLYSRIEIIPGFFSLVHVRNTGAAFSLLAHIKEATLIFGIVSLCAVAILHVIVTRLEHARFWDIIPLGLILGGAIGNFTDRMRLGAVIDFLDFYIGNVHWPAFNVADSAITCGAILLGIRMLSNASNDRIT